MAYIVSSQSAIGTTMPTPVHQSGDVIVCGYSQRYGSVATPSGWNTIVSFSSVNSYYGQVYWKAATSSSETIPNGQNSSGEKEVCITTIIRGADTTTFIDESATLNPSGLAYSAPDITPTYDNALILYAHFGGYEHRDIAPYVGIVNVITQTNNSNYLSLDYTYGGVGGVQVDGWDYIGEGDASYLHRFVAFSVLDAGDDANGGYIDRSAPPATLIHGLLRGGYNGDNTGVSRTYDPTTEVPSISNDSFSNSTQYLGLTAGESLESAMGSSELDSSSASTKVLIAGSDLESTTDLSGKILSITHIGTPRTSASQIGKVIGLTDKTNSKIWQIAGGGIKPSANASTFNLIEVDTGTEIDEIGVFDSSSIDAVLLGSECSTTHNAWGWLYALETMTLVGGSSYSPCNMDLAVACAETSSLNTVQNQNYQSDSQYAVFQNVQVGNAVTPTRYEGKGTAIAYPQAYDRANLRVQAQISTGSLGYKAKPSEYCYLDFSQHLFDMGDYHEWGVAYGGDEPVFISFNLTSVYSSTPVLNNVGTAIGGLVVADFKQIQYTDLMDLSGGNVFNGCIDTYAVSISSEEDFEKLHNNTFSNCDKVIRITGDQSGTIAGGDAWDDPNLTVSGNTKDIEYTGTTDFEIQSANTLTVLNSSSGELTIVTPTVSLTINSDTASSLIRYFEDDSQTATSTTGTSLVYTYPDTDPIDIEVLKQGYVPVNRQDVTPYNDDYNIILDFDEAYNSSHDLVITTDYTYNRATKVLAIVADQEALDVRSALADLIRTNSSYYNTPLLMDVIGGLVRVDMIDGMTCSDMAKWKGAGSEVYDAADSTNPIERWCAVKTVGGITGATTHYRQTSSGDSTALTLTNNVVNEALQYWSDPDHDGTPATDTSEYLLIKAFLAGSKQDRVDILAASGDTELRSTLYQVGLANEDHGYSGADPGITADMTLVAGGTVGGKVFAYKIVDGGTNSGSDIANQLNYNAANNPNTVIAGGTGLRYFELPDMVIHNASAVETEYGYKEGATPTLVGFYVERSGADHPDFTRFQADDGTYYVKPVTANISITNLPNDGTQRLQIYNTTTAKKYYNDDPASTGYSNSYTDGVGISAGDSIRIRFTEINGSTSFKSFDTVVVATSDGFSVDASNFIETDTVYAANAVDGTTITKFTADFIDDEIDLAAASNFTASEAYAFFCSTLVTSQGIEEFWDGVTAIDSGNYRINQSAVNIYFDNTTTTNLRQTDSARIYRADEAYPVKSGGITTGGGGIDMNWQNVVYTVETGSGMTSGQEAKIDAIQSKVTPMTYTVANELDVNAKTITAVLNDLSSAEVNAACDTAISDANLATAANQTTIKAKTDQLTFTKANELDANAKSMNDAEVLGDGTSSDLWRGE